MCHTMDPMGYSLLESVLSLDPQRPEKDFFSEEAFLLPFNVFGGSSKVFLPWTNIETMFSTSPWVLVFKLLFFKTLRKWCPQLDESFCWTQWRENPPTRSAKILPWFYNGISIWEHPNQVAKRMSWCRFLSEKLPNWSILVETFTNMGNKEPNSTCFIARFLNHQLGVAMGVMMHPPKKS